MTRVHGGAYLPANVFVHLHHMDVLDGERLHYVKSPQAGADKWAASAGAAQQAFSTGVQNTNVDVAARAVAAQDRLLRGFTDAVTSGRWARRITETGTSGWKSRTIAKASNYGTGIAAGKDNYLSAASKLYPYIQQMQNEIAGMPKGGAANAKARSSFAIDFMMAYKNRA